MKKTTYLIAIFIAFYSFTFAQCPGTPLPGFTCIPNAIFEQALIDEGIDLNPVIDGRILTAEAEAFTGELYLEGLGISDFTGIEAFTQLSRINAGYNSMTTLDLSNSPNINRVRARGCPNLTSINLDNLSVLSVLDMGGSQLTALDLSNSTTVLTSVILNLNNIVSLDLSAQTLLTNVNLFNNELTFLDMRNGNNGNVTFFDVQSNSNLLCIFVDDMDAPYLMPPIWYKSNSSNYVNDQGGCETLSVNSVDAETFNMYPNPTENVLNINTKASNAELEIYNITGKIVFTKTLVQGKNSINVSNLPSGIYLTRFISENKVDTKKLIIQ
jgi:hypothetical protein